MEFDFYDISPEIHEGIAVFPGDQKFQRNIAMDINSGDHLNLSSFTSTVHLGAHADAPSHYNANGIGISERSLKYYYGSCQVMQVSKQPGERIYPNDLPEEVKSPRLLFRTDSFKDPNKWVDDFNSLSPELIDYLVGKKVITVGIDTPSVDPADSKKLESHKAIAKSDLAILEGLVLNEVPNGFYTLIALPLKLKDVDASPVRAILLK